MVIGTHHGRFHADEVFAVAVLKQLYPDAEVVRTRNPDMLQTCDIVVDVGGGSYDHHSTEKVYRENGVPYASVGLIWRDYGQMLVRQFGGEAYCAEMVNVIDEKLLQGIDAMDNGYDLDKDYRIKSVSDLIGGFNPQWNSSKDENEAFLDAVSFASGILINQIRTEISRMEARQVVVRAFQHRPSKELMVLDTFCPWTETLLHLDEREEVLFVVFPDRSGGYRVQVVPAAAGSFAARKSLPATWAGKEGEELGRIVSISDAVFCHPARFIAGALSLQGALTMAKTAIENPEI